MQPLYTPENCHLAYQLRWSLALFERQRLPDVDSWRDRLAVAVERDGVRLMEVSFEPPKSWLLLLSTRPDVAPSAIVKSVKGRLQRLLRPNVSQAFQRNFSLTSVGDANSEMIQHYVAGQVQHHSSPECQLPDDLQDFQWQNPEVDLSQPVFSSHGRYITNLHLVMENKGRQPVMDRAHWRLSREMLKRAATKKGHRLAAIGLLPDHLHVFVGVTPAESPQDVALSCLNNLAFAHGMQPEFSFGGYIGTIGPYHMQAIRRRL